MISEKELTSRIRIFGILVLFLFLVLFLRLWYLQIARGDEYDVMSKNNRVRLLSLEAPRGLIRDRNGEILATSRFAPTVSIVPMEWKNSNHVIEVLSEIIQMSTEDIEKKIAASAWRPFEPVRIKIDISPEVVIKIEERRIDLPGVIIEQLPVRQYVLGNFATHILGYIGEINEEELKALKGKGYSIGDLFGKIGVEKTFEENLKGIKGIQQVEVNALSRPVRILGEESPIPGNDIVLTIDRRLQEIVEVALEEGLIDARKDPRYKDAKGGAIIVMDVRNGEILAMASAPDYDPNLFVGGISVTNWNKLIEDPYRPLYNRVMSGEYPPGSTFKIITAFAALEEGLVDLNDKFYCTGSDPTIPDKKCAIWYSTGSGHGEQNLIESIKNSCNITFYELGKRIGVNKLAEYARDFGFGSPTGINVSPGDKGGLVPTKEWKLEKRFLRWVEPAETMDFSIGQGFFNATLLQIAAAYATIANGGTLYKPLIVKAINSSTGDSLRRFEPQVVREIHMSPMTEMILKEGMRRVTVDGSAREVFADFPISTAGKTGTAEVSGADNHAWFAAFAPAESPEVVVIVLVENGGYGGKVAAPIARKALEAYFRL